MEGMVIKLTLEEQTLWDSIKDKGFPLGHHVENAETLRVQSLLSNMIYKRGAIPEIRIKYFTDPEFNTSNPKRSIQDTFKFNGTSGNDLFSHPHFKPFLYYFIEGPALPEAIMKEASDLYSKTTFRDDYPEALAKIILKSKKVLLSLISKDVLAEEVFKLLIEYGCQDYQAKTIRTKIKSWKG